MTWGGKRHGAGRPKGQGPYGEPTKVMRIPVSLEQRVRAFVQHEGEGGIPLYTSNVQAGFPSPADDYVDQKLNLNDHLIQNPPATFFVRVAGDSMQDAHMEPGDLLVVDRSIEAKPGHIVVVALDGELTVKRLLKKEGQLFLKPENKKYPLMPLSEAQSTMVWGVVTTVIKRMI